MNKKIPKKSFLKYTIAWISIFSVVSISIFGIFSFLAIKESSRLFFQQRTDEIVKSANYLFNNEIERYKNQLNNLANDEELEYILNKSKINEQDKSVLSNKMFTILSNKSSKIALHIIKEDFSLSTDRLPQMYDLKKFGNWGILRYLKNNGTESIYPNYYLWQNKKINSFSISSKLIKNDKVYGYIIMDFTQDYVKDLLNTLEMTNIGKIKFIISSLEGFVIFNNSEYKNIISPSYLKDILIQNKEYMNLSVVNNNLKIKIYGLIHNSYIKTNIEIFYSIFLNALVPTFFFAACIVIVISNKMVKPILSLAKRVRGIEMDKQTFEKTRNDELGEIEEAFIELLNKINDYHVVDIAKREQLKIAEIKMLQSQINPHFLYNTLDSIKWKAKLNHVDDIAKMVMELGNVLKSSMNYNETIVSVKKEIGLIQSYIYIQKERYVDRFDFVLNVEERVLEFLIPKFLLQPLIENAITHGMEKVSSKVLIELNAYCDDKFLYFEVIDNGKGFNRNLEEILNDNSSTSIALKNINKRIKLYYGEEFNLSLDKNYLKGTKMFIKILKEI